MSGGEGQRLQGEDRLASLVITPHIDVTERRWAYVLDRFDDCFKLGKRIDEGPYLLPDPEILRGDPERSVEMPASQHMEGATSAQPRHIPPSTQSAREPLSVFNSKKVMLAKDLALSPRLREIIDEIITSSSGQITDDVEECDMFICQYRDGSDYVRAAKLCKEVGNLSWLYHLITTDQWSSPLRRLLHYPVPRNGIPGFADFRVTLSNYGGEARPYLTNLIKAAGATYTKTMKAENTHLITARDNSEKCEAAADWGINMVNHLWIEESYAKCAVQPYTNNKYTHFPSRTNLGEVIGQTFFDEEILREMYYPGEEENLPPSAKRRRLILQAAQANAYDRGPAQGIAIGREDVKVWREEAVKQTPVTPAPKKHAAADKENDTPSAYSTGSRSAKSKAAATLRLLASDIDKYDKEKKRHSKDGKGVWGGKRAADQLEHARQEANSKKVKKETEDDAEAEEEEEEAEETKRPSKKRRKMEKPYNITVTITGYQRWVDDPRKEDKDRVSLRVSPRYSYTPLTPNLDETGRAGHPCRPRDQRLPVPRRPPHLAHPKVPLRPHPWRDHHIYRLPRHRPDLARGRRPKRLPPDRPRRREDARHEARDVGGAGASQRREAAAGDPRVLHAARAARGQDVRGYRAGVPRYVEDVRRATCNDQEGYAGGGRRGREA